MYMIWSGEWDCGASPKKFDTLGEVLEWLDTQNTTPLECLEFYCSVPEDLIVNTLKK